MSRKVYGFVAVASLAFAAALAASVSVAATTYTRDLTIGSTGADVASLQSLLVSKGFLVMPAGVPMGYFGGLTKSALAKWQASVGISPAAGYFGPITRGFVNNMSMGSGDTGNSGNSGSSSDLQGGEGDIKSFKILGSPSNATVREGETKKVLGFEFEAKGSDLRVERVEVTASSTLGQATSKRDPWKYFTSATLWHGSHKVASVDNLDDEDSWDEGDDNVYSFRFEGVDTVVKEGDKDQFYVEVTAKDTLDTNRVTAKFDVYLDTDAVRAVDAEGIDIYEGQPSDEKVVTFDKANTGDVDVNIDDDQNKDRTVFVDEDNETNGVEILRFTVESQTSDNVVKELSVNLATSTATNTQLSSVVRSLTLEVDGEEVGSESVDSGTGTSTATFNDLDVDIAENDEVEFVVLADLNEESSNYGDGYKFYAAVLASSFDIEDAQGDSVTPTGDVYGGDVELRANGIQIDYTSSSATRTNGSVAGDADNVEFKINFKVTANGDDVYLDGDVVATGTPSSVTDGLAWSTTSDTTTATGTPPTGIVTASDGYKSSDTNSAGDKRFKISKGNSRNFTFTVSIPAGADNVTAGVQLNGFKWDTTSQDSMSNLYTIDLADFRTDIVTGLYVR